MKNISRLTAYLNVNAKKISLSLGEFILIKVIGQGGNGLVYEASFVDKIVAIKFLITDDEPPQKKWKFCN